MKVCKQEEKVSVVIDFTSICEKAVVIFVISVAILMMGFFGYLAEYYNIETVFLTVCVVIASVMGISGMVIAASIVIDSL